MVTLAMLHCADGGQPPKRNKDIRVDCQKHACFNNHPEIFLHLPSYIVNVNGYLLPRGGGYVMMRVVSVRLRLKFNASHSTYN